MLLRSLISLASLLLGRWLQRLWPQSGTKKFLGATACGCFAQVYWGLLSNLSWSVRKNWRICTVQIRNPSQMVTTADWWLMKSDENTGWNPRYAYYKRYGHDTICMPASWRPSRKGFDNYGSMTVGVLHQQTSRGETCSGLLNSVEFRWVSLSFVEHTERVCFLFVLLSCLEGSWLWPGWNRGTNNFRLALQWHEE